jgi:hypothetical protein
VIFEPEHVRLIRDHRKSQARIPVDVVTAVPLKVVPCRYVPGRMYAVTSRASRRTELYVTVFDVRQQALAEVSAIDVRREGFMFRRDFERYWERLHGGYDPDMLIWAIAFRPGDYREHFDRPRLLKATPGVHAPDAVEHQDYTDRPDLAVAFEPEALTEAQLKPYVREAHQRDDVRRRTEAAERPRVERLRELELRARAGDRQAQRSLFVIDQRIQRSERRTPREAYA